ICQFRPYVFELFFNKSGNIQKVNRPEELKNQYLLTVDIPKEVAKKFKSRFSGAQDVTWETSEGNWWADFIYRDLPTSAEFTDSAQWVSTIVELDTKDLYAPIQRFLDNQYSDYKVMYAEKTTRKDRKDYYYIDLISKKKNLSSQQIALFFDKTGRLIEKD
ncbi:MAG: PepSY-like domain-containing protein, partial [Bacteroidales bacterium]|nr:PepSY-like domain-containing protein [Bacteroidales bacterium]